MALRFEAPGIATKILISGDSFEFEYVSPTTEEQVNEWVATTLLEKSSCKSPQDLISSLVNDAEEREKYCPEYAGFASRLYFASGKEEGQYHICLYSQHAALDGRGSLLALDILLRHLPAPEMIKEWGGEIDRLPLSASYAIGLRKDGDVAPEGFAGIMQAMQDQQTKHQVRVSVLRNRCRNRSYDHASPSALCLILSTPQSNQVYLPTTPDWICLHTSHQESNGLRKRIILLFHT